MGIRLYNTLKRTYEEFEPSRPGRVSMYVCGLTVQGPAHLGHARGPVAFDVIRRYLEYRGFETFLVYNWTDVDDKIVEKASAEGIPYQQVAQRNIEATTQQLAALRVKPASVYPRATQHIQEMIDMVAGLIEKGHAYAVDGDVYFSVPTYPEYGALSRRPLEEMRPGERIELDERKRSPLDFTLWKAAKEGEPSWESPWGPGRPGWHIECSAMSLKYLGDGFDIHGGGDDLIFPHHENELAQSNCFTGSGIFARYWMHNGLVKLGGGKMSKSEGNVVNLTELLRKYEPAVLRLYLLTTHYRHPITFSWDELEAQARSLDRVRLALMNVRRVLKSPDAEAAGSPEAEGDDLEVVVSQSLQRFEEAMDDDFNTAVALAVIYDLTGEMNRVINAASFRLTPSMRTALEQALTIHGRMSGVLQVFTEDETGADEDESLAPKLLDLLVALRAEARARRDFATGDRIRDSLKELGVTLEDHRDGTSWRSEK